MEHASKETPELLTGPTGEHQSVSELVNASGHVQELRRNFSLVSLAGVGLVVGNVWPAVGGSILVALFNGGPPGVLYEFIAVSVFYWLVAASIAELASAIPSSAGVYHWASVTPGPKWGRVIGFLAGWWNYLGWVIGAASTSAILGNIVVQMYAFKHPDFVARSWHVFVAYIAVTWLSCFTVCFFNRAMPHLNNVGIVLILGGFLTTVIVLAVMPGSGGRPPHASSSFVWKDFTADIGYPNGFVFVAGMLNGAYSVGTPDAVSHLSEEIVYPHRNVPIAIGLQMSIGFITGLFFLIALMYTINDFDALSASPFPLAELYRQATGSESGAIGLLMPFLFCGLAASVGIYITTGRTLWALSRDGATPFPSFLGQVNKRLEMPLNSTLATAALVTVLGCIYVGSTTAFNALVGSFVLMSSSSYIAAILPNLLTGRKNIHYGPFRMGGVGFIVNGIACAYMIVWFVIYCFPFYLPVDAKTMNYSSLLWGGLTLLITIWWFVGARKGYTGPTATGGVISEAELITGKGEKKNVPTSPVLVRNS